MILCQYFKIYSYCYKTFIYKYVVSFWNTTYLCKHATSLVTLCLRLQCIACHSHSSTVFHATTIVFKSSHRPRISREKNMKSSQENFNARITLPFPNLPKNLVEDAE